MKFTQAQLIAVGWNAVFGAGALVCAYGFWLAWRPLGFIGGGVVLALLGFGGGLEQARRKRRDW